MTNPSDAVGTNGAYGGRTSVDALNDVLGTFSGAGVLSGWNVRADSGMSVLVGGQSGVRDVAVAEDQLGDRTTVNNRLGSPISLTLESSSPSTARVDSIVLYVNKPATVTTTDIDNPGVCGIIAVNGTTVAPTDADIRSAITADGGTGATAYFVVIADITIPASATVITNTNITNYSGKLLGSGMIADSAITTGKIADGQITTAKLKGASTANTTDTWLLVDASGEIQHRVAKPFNADGTIPAAALASNSVTTAKIAANAVTKAKVDDSGMQAPTVSGAYCYYRRSGHFVWVSGNSSGFALSANNYKTLFTLPSGYRPTIDIYCPLGLSSATAMGILRIRTSGEVQGWATTATSYWNFSTTFAID